MTTMIAPPGLKGVTVADTAVGDVRGTESFYHYRQYSAPDLARTRTVEEVWYVIRGQGRMWRKMDNQEEVTELTPGISVAIPTGMHFQFRNNGAEPLEIVAATMPPWPGEGEAYFVEDKWPATV